MKTKEEILDCWDWSNKSEILEAMDEYAIQILEEILNDMGGGGYIERLIVETKLKELKNSLNE